MWQQAIYKFGDESPRKVIMRTDPNVMGQRAALLDRDRWLLIVDTPTLILAFTHNKLEVWVYKKLE